MRKKKRNEEREEREERKEIRGKKEREGKSMRGGKRGNKGKGLRFSVFRLSEVVCPRIKVGLLDESYK